MRKNILGAISVIAILSTTFVTFAQNAPDKATNKATVSSPTTDPTPANNTATVVDKICFEADLFTLLSDAREPVKETLSPLDLNTYTGKIGNLGLSTVEEAQFIFIYDTRDYSAVTLPTASSGTVTEVSSSDAGTIKTIVYKLAGITLQKGQTIDVTIPVVTSANPSNSANALDPINGVPVASPTAVLAKFSATPTGPANTDPDCTIIDKVSANNLSQDTTTTELKADMAIVKTSTGGSNSVGSIEGKFISGNSYDYELTATNNGPSTAQGPITVIDTIPGLVDPTNVVNGVCTPGLGTTAGVTCTYNAGTREMTFTLAQPLPNGQSITIKIPVKVF
jgi:large repetitive protein